MSQIVLHNTFGATFVGGVFASFLYGIMTLQTYMYWMRYPDDSAFDRIFVLVLWLFDTAHMVCVNHLQYHYVITNYMNPIALTSSVWSLNFEIGLTTVTTFMVQAYFARRAWYFTKRVGTRFTTTTKSRMMAIVIGLISLIQLGCGLATFSLTWSVVKFEKFPQYRVLVGVWLGAAALCDVLIMVMLSSVLMTQRTGFGRTNALINKILFYTVNTGLLTSLFAIADLVTFCTMNNLIHFGFNFVLGKIYTNMLLATLNARKAEDGPTTIHVSENSVRLGDMKRGQAASSIQFHHSHSGVTTQDPNVPTIHLQTETAVYVSESTPRSSPRDRSHRSSKVVAIDGSGEPYNANKDAEYDADGTESIDTRAESLRK